MAARGAAWTPVSDGEGGEPSHLPARRAPACSSCTCASARQPGTPAAAAPVGDAAGRACEHPCKHRPPTGLSGNGSADHANVAAGNAFTPGPLRSTEARRPRTALGAPGQAGWLRSSPRLAPRPVRAGPGRRGRIRALPRAPLPSPRRLSRWSLEDSEAEEPSQVLGGRLTFAGQNGTFLQAGALSGRVQTPKRFVVEAHRGSFKSMSFFYS